MALQPILIGSALSSQQPAISDRPLWWRETKNRLNSNPQIQLHPFDLVWVVFR